MFIKTSNLSFPRNNGGSDVAEPHLAIFHLKLISRNPVICMALTSSCMMALVVIVIANWFNNSMSSAYSTSLELTDKWMLPVNLGV